MARSMMRFEGDVYKLDLGDDWMEPVWRSTPLEEAAPRKCVATPSRRAADEESARRAEERRRAKRAGEMPARELIAIRERYGLSWTRLAQIMGCSPSSVTSYAKSGPVPGPRAKRLRAWIAAGMPRPTPKRKPEPVAIPERVDDEARALLVKWRITSRDLADRLGVSRAAASDWIDGRREISPTRRAQIIAWLT